MHEDLWAKHWTPLCHVSEVSEPNQYVLVPWSFENEAVVSHTADGPVVWDNRCPHRGARIYTESAGAAEPVCAYHGRRANMCDVRKFASSEARGLVWASGGPAVFPEVASRLSVIGHFKLHSQLSFTMDCHWTVAVENALDSEHVSSVHSRSLASLQLSSLCEKLLPGGSSTEWFDSKRGGELDRLEFSLKSYQPEGRRVWDYQHAHIFPFTCISTVRGLTYSIQHYFPRTDGRTSFIHKLYTHLEGAAADHYHKSVAAMNKQVFEEDAGICARVPAGHQGLLAPNEVRIQHFRRTCERR